MLDELGNALRRYVDVLRVNFLYETRPRAAIAKAMAMHTQYIQAKFGLANLRGSERKDTASLEKFEEMSRPAGSKPSVCHLTHRAESSLGSRSNFAGGVLVCGHL